jgi:hypothetical protein
VAIPSLSDPHSVPLILLYVGPDQIMPLTSVLGAILGLALLFWNRLMGLVRKCLTMFSRRSDQPSTASPPADANVSAVSARGHAD